MDAIGYVRVSTEGQVTDGVSLEAQGSKIGSWCDAHSYNLIKVYTDAGISGSRFDNRPSLQMALTEACKRKAALVVYSLSRLARSTKDAIIISERLAKAGADLVSLSERIDTTSAAGKMVFRMLAVLAEFERDQVAERTRTAMAHLRSQRRRISGMTPFGYELSPDGRSLVPNAREQDCIRLIQELKAGGMGRRRIAAALMARGISSKTGVQWPPQAIKRILDREAIQGAA